MCLFHVVLCKGTNFHKFNWKVPFLKLIFLLSDSYCEEARNGHRNAIYAVSALLGLFWVIQAKFLLQNMCL